MTEETRLTVPGEKHPADSMWDDADELVVLTDLDTSAGGTELLKPRDFGPLPRWVLVQGTTVIEGLDKLPEPGMMFHTGTMRAYDTRVNKDGSAPLRFFGLRFLDDSQVWYFEPFDRDEPPFCRSSDGVNPDEETELRPMQNRQPGPCATCEMNQWGDGSPVCTLQRNFLICAVDVNTNLFLEGQLTLQRSMIRTARTLTDHMDKVGLRSWLTLATYQFTDDKRRTWWMPAFGIGKPAQELAIRYMAEYRDSLTKRLAAGELYAEVDLSGGAGNVVDGEVVADTEESLAPKPEPPAPKRRRRKQKETTPPPPEDPPFNPDDDEILF